MKLPSVLLLLLLPPVLTSCEQDDLPVDCSDIYKNNGSRPSGVYTVYPTKPTCPLQVFCEMDSSGGWTVFHRRMDGTVNFYRPWNQYKTGFGNLSGEHWLGLENLFHLTLERKCELLVVMEDFEGHTASARYSSFSIDPESHGFGLQVSGFRDGEAGDALSYHNGQKFSTMDKDQDAWKNGNCARKHLGAFWYRDCHETNPNGVYRWGYDDTLYAVGVEWKHWKKYDYSLKSFTMKIRSA